MKNYLLILGIIFILLVSACSQQPAQTKSQPKIITSEEKPAGEASQQAEKPEEKTTDSPSSVKEFDITARQFEFIPSVIRVNKGDKVKLNVRSADVTHGFSIPELNVNENIKPCVTKTIEFTADKTGEFTFFCSVYCGAGHTGMKGKLIVE